MKDREVLLQEKYAETTYGPWKVLVTCQMLNQTTWMQAESALEAIFAKWPTPAKLLMPSGEEIMALQSILKPLGLVGKRLEYLASMSQQFWKIFCLYGQQWHKYHVHDFRGCGRYAEDAWTLFVLKERCKPQDKRLKYYAEKVGLYG